MASSLFHHLVGAEIGAGSLEFGVARIINGPGVIQFKKSPVRLGLSKYMREFFGLQNGPRIEKVGLPGHPSRGEARSSLGEGARCVTRGTSTPSLPKALVRLKSVHVSMGR